MLFLVTMDRPIIVYLKQHVFEHSALFAFQYLTESEKIFLMLFFYRTVLKHYHVLGANYFVMKIFSKSFA